MSWKSNSALAKPRMRVSVRSTLAIFVPDMPHLPCVTDTTDYCFGVGPGLRGLSSVHSGLLAALRARCRALFGPRFRAFAISRTCATVAPLWPVKYFGEPKSIFTGFAANHTKQMKFALIGIW